MRFGDARSEACDRREARQARHRTSKPLQEKCRAGSPNPAGLQLEMKSRRGSATPPYIKHMNRGLESPITLLSAPPGSRAALTPRAGVSTMTTQHLFRAFLILVACAGFARAQSTTG